MRLSCLESGTIGVRGSLYARAQVANATPHPHGVFGEDRFGRLAEKTARFFGTPQYIIGQTIIVAAWIAINVLAVTKSIHFDVRPFILLNLIFSTQAAYAAPLILLAQTRQADRDKSDDERVDARHSRLELALKGETDRLVTLLESNTQLTQQDKELTQEVADLTKQIHVLLTQRSS